MELSVLIIARNEEENIGDCLESVRFAGEIVVIDAFSNDRTVEVCRKYTDKVFQRIWDNYSSQKNFGHTHCHYDWILSIDADERITPELRAAIDQAILHDDAVAYRIPIRDFMFGRWIEHGSWPQQHHIRLYRKTHAHWESIVHEKLVVDGSIGMLAHPLLHFSHTSISKFIYKLNLYTDTEAEQWYRQGIRKSWPIIIFSSLRIFWLQYFYYQGWRDQGHGFILAVLMSVYHFVARVKLWELWYKHDHETTQNWALTQQRSTESDESSAHTR